MAQRGRNRSARLLLFLLIAAGATYVYYTPHLAFEQMKAAANNRDPVALSQYINFPSLRQSVRENVQEKLAKGLGKENEKNPFVLIGAAFGTAFAGPTIDRLVTPENLAMMMNGERLTVQRVAGEFVFASAPPGSGSTTSMQYTGPNEFVVTHRINSLQDPMILVLHRSDDFVSWKLTAVKLPL